MDTCFKDTPSVGNKVFLCFFVREARTFHLVSYLISLHLVTLSTLGHLSWSLWCHPTTDVLFGEYVIESLVKCKILYFTTHTVTFLGSSEECYTDESVIG